ncbi:MAG: hypothetical protein F6K08_11840 [Okeania sp. SIO1H6]|nr:hypothetical protein [Okeania sp. SIO1H6]
MEKKKLELRISYTKDSDYNAFIDYFQRHRMNPRSMVLDAIRLLWEPYVISEDRDVSQAELERLVDISFQRYLNHYQLMCVELGLKRPGLEGGFAPTSSNISNGAGESLKPARNGQHTVLNSQPVHQVPVPKIDTGTDNDDGEFSADDLPEVNFIEGGFDFD